MANELSNRELSVFFREMALLQKAGITPAEGVSELLDDAKDDPVLKQMKDVLNEGATFHDALKACNVFPSYVTGMVRIGEEAGALDTVLTSLADHYEREEGIRESIKSAVIYPCLMILMMLVIVFVLVTRVLPIFSLVFSQLGTSLSGISGALLHAGQVLNRYSIVLLIVLALLVLLFLYFYATAAGRKKAASFLEGFPPTKAIRKDIASGRFADALSLMFKSGIPLTEETMEMTKDLVDHREMRNDITRFYDLVEKESVNIPDALKNAGIFSGLYASLMRAGFKAGEQDAVMERIAVRYREDTDEKLYRLIGAIEPTLVIALSVIVGLILLSVILPLIGVMSNLG